MNRVEEIIERVEEYVKGCKGQAFSSTKIICERESMLDFLEEIRKAIPEELAQGQKIMKQREDIMATARKKADFIIKEAQDKADEMVREHEITLQAEAEGSRIMEEQTEKANAILEEAITDATQIRVGAINYTDKLMKNLSRFIKTAYENQKENVDKILDDYQNQLDVLNANREDLSNQLAVLEGRASENDFVLSDMNLEEEAEENVEE